MPTPGVNRRPTGHGYGQRRVAPRAPEDRQPRHRDDEPDQPTEDAAMSGDCQMAHPPEWAERPEHFLRCDAENPQTCPACHAALGCTRALGRTPSSARARYEDVSSRAEAALTSGDPAKRQAWLDAMTQAEKELHVARHGPSWESLLADPTSQPFGADEVAASVRAYEDAPLASACACGGSMHKRCNP